MYRDSAKLLGNVVIRKVLGRTPTPDTKKPHVYTLDIQLPPEVRCLDGMFLGSKYQTSGGGNGCLGPCIIFKHQAFIWANYWWCCKGCKGIQFGNVWQFAQIHITLRILGMSWGFHRRVQDSWGRKNKIIYNTNLPWIV